MKNGEGFGFCPQTYRPAKTRTAHADATEPGRPDGLPTFATVTDSDNRFNITKNHYDIKQGGQKVPHHIADKRPCFKSKLLGFIASVMDSLIGQSTNLDDQVTP